MIEQEYCNPKVFKPRMNPPKSGNQFYNTKSVGGFSTACKGSPTQNGLNVLSNCVGFAFGRFNEIAGNTKMSYLKPVNAELFMQYKGSLEVGMEPRIGAVMVWQKGATLNGSDGAGHVAICEKVISSTEVITSESGWKAKNMFWNQVRKKGNGNWGQSSSYKFLGFIYNPAECCQPKSNSNSISNNSTTKPSTSTNSNSTSNSTITTKPTQTQVKAKQAAKSKDTKLSGTYTVTAKIGLNLRDGAGTGSDSLVLIPYGTKVKNYGYYTMLNGSKWMYVQVTIDGITYTGFCLSSYLKK